MVGPSLCSGSDFGPDSRSVYCLDSQRHCSIDVELYPLHKTVRIVGVDEQISCSDFAIRVCRLLSLKPNRYTLKVLDLSNPPHAVWRRPPLCSKLKFWLDHVPSEHHTPVFRLLSNSYVKSTSTSVPYSPPLTGDSRNTDHVFSGLDLLKQLGTRIVVHLPGRRKMVVRAHIDHPVFDAVLEICKKRRLPSGCYFLCNPRNDIPIDPSASFSSQGLSELELRACSVENSDLTALADSMILVGSTNSGVCHVESFVSTKGTKSANRGRSESSDVFIAHGSTNPVLRSHSVGPLNSSPPDVADKHSDSSSLHSMYAMCKWTGTRAAPLNYKKRRAPLPPVFRHTPTSCATAPHSAYLLDSSSVDDDYVPNDFSATPTALGHPKCSSRTIDLHSTSTQHVSGSSTSNLDVIVLSSSKLLRDEDKSAIGSHSDVSYTIERDEFGGCKEISVSTPDGCFLPSPPHQSHDGDASPRPTEVTKSVTRNGHSCVRRATYVNDTEWSSMDSSNNIMSSHPGPPVPPRPSLEILTRHPKYRTLVSLLSRSSCHLEYNGTPRAESCDNTSARQRSIASTGRSSTSTLSITLKPSYAM